MSVQERLRRFISYKNLTYKGFEVACGFGNGTAKRFNESIKKRTIDSIVATFPDLNADWLLTGEGKMLRPYIIDEVEELTAEEEQRVRQDVAAGRATAVPLCSLDVRGGFDSAIEEIQGVSSYIVWPDAHQGDFAVEVSGTSMSPVIPSGSRVLLRKVDGWQIYLEPNTLYTLELQDDRRLLKEVHDSHKGEEYLTLHSYNPQTPDKDIPKSFVRRVYKVVAIMTHYGF